MPSFQVDDELPFHPRVVAAGNAAMGLWVRAAAWSMGHLTDGHVKRRVARTMGTLGDIRSLVKAGLWAEEIDADGDESYVFHAWAHDSAGRKRQQSAEEILNRRRGNLESKRRGTARNQAGRFTTKPLVGGDSTENVGDGFTPADGEVVTPSDGDTSSVSPTPTYSPPSEERTPDKPASSRRGATRIPEPFVVTREMREWAAREVPGVDVDAVTREFVDFWRAAVRDALKRDWESTWRNRLRKVWREQGGGAVKRTGRDRYAGMREL